MWTSVRPCAEAAERRALPVAVHGAAVTASAVLLFALLSYMPT